MQVKVNFFNPERAYTFEAQSVWVTEGAYCRVLQACDGLDVNVYQGRAEYQRVSPTMMMLTIVKPVR